MSSHPTHYFFYSLSPPLLIPMYGSGMNGRNDGYWLYNFRDSGMDLCPYPQVFLWDT